MLLRSLVTVAIVLAASAPWVASAANASEPHPHQGLIPRLQLEGKPDIKLSAADLESIENGDLWTQSYETNGVGRGIGVRDIAAPLDVVYNEVSDLKGYVGKVPMLKSLKVYSKESKKNLAIEKAAYSVKVIPGYYFDYFVEHHGLKEKGVLLFFLDYERSSDFNDLQGKWYLEKHPTKEGWTRVYYQCDLKLFGYAPSIVKRLLTSQGLVSAIGWVKKESEKRAPKPVGQLVEAFAHGAGTKMKLRVAPRSAGQLDPSLPAPDATYWEAYIPSPALLLASIATATVASRRLSRSRRARSLQSE